MPAIAGVDGSRFRHRNVPHWMLSYKPMKGAIFEGDCHDWSAFGLGAHCRVRELATLGHQVRLIPPFCVKLLVKRAKTDAEAIRANLGLVVPKGIHNMGVL